MTKKYKAIIYTGNNDTIGTEDFYEQLVFLSKDLGNSIISNRLSFNCDKIFIVENFANPINLIKVFFFLLLFKGKSYLIHTEFITDNKKNISFNDFKGEFNYSLIEVMVYYPIWKILSAKILNLSDKQKFVRNKFLSYFKIRYFTTKLIINLFSYVIKAHPKMKFKNYNLKNVEIIDFPYKFPLLELDENKEFMLDFSGFLTPYRHKFLKNIEFNNKLFLSNRIEDLIAKNENNFFIKSKKNNEYLIFSLHVEKEDGWQYSSPARYYNSLKKGEVPIIFKKFSDNYLNCALDSSILYSQTKNNVFDHIFKLNQNLKNENKIRSHQIIKLINS